MAENFDQIVIGAGMAGVCCAGELVLNGQRPLLICEAPEVASVYRVKKLGENSTFFIQNLFWQLGWGGGWWMNLARRLNVPFQMSPGADFAITIQGEEDRILPLSVPGSPAALVEMLGLLMGGDAIDSTLSEPIERIVTEALALSYEALHEMNDVLYFDWLVERGADELVSLLLLTLSAFANDMSALLAREHLSVFGAISTLRMLIFSEGLMMLVHPNVREGLMVPMARAIENRGGTISRGKKIDKVIIEGNSVKGVAFKDGSHVECSTVAIANSNGFISRMFDSLPEEAVAPISQTVPLYDFNSAYLLDRPMVEGRSAIVTFSPATLSADHIMWPLTSIAPWTTEPGKQVVGTHFSFTTEEITERGGAEAIYASMLARADEYRPGLAEAVVDRVDFTTTPTGTAWLSPVTVGPKLPQRSTSVEGLWFVGDGSDGTRGIWSEAAASGGIRGAQAMIKER